MAHILIVDDEDSIRLLIRKVLESDGHSVFEAQDGRVALDILETHPDPFDMIVLDLRMPCMDGVEFLSTLHNQISYRPIIVLSAHEGPIPKEIEHKVSGRLTKPFSKRELIDMVSSLLSLHIALPSS